MAASAEHRFERVRELAEGGMARVDLVVRRVGGFERLYALGYDAGTIIPNFSGAYTGSAPDMGAHEAGTPPVVYGTASNIR